MLQGQTHVTILGPEIPAEFTHGVVLECGALTMLIAQNVPIMGELIRPVH